jgi:hypothetical protein
VMAQSKLSARMQAAHTVARANPQAGVNAVIAMLNEAGNDSGKVQNIMDAATRYGFVCEFWPTGIRVTWPGKKK